MDYTTLYDSEGNPVELPVKPEEFKTVLETKTELETKLAEKEAELSKLRDKDFNFASLRTKSEQEKEEIMKEFSAKEKAVYQELEAIRKERDEERASQLSEARNSYMRELTGGDEELTKQIELHEKEFAGEAKTPKEVQDRLTKAYTLVRGMRPSVNPINRYVPSGDQTQTGTRQRFSDTPDGEAFMKAHFPQVAKKIFKP